MINDEFKKIAFQNYPNFVICTNFKRKLKQYSLKWKSRSRYPYDASKYYETEFIVTNVSNGEVVAMFKDIWIYNITSIENVTLNYHGMNDFSQVNATQCYYNLTSAAIEAYEDPYEFALFGYNSSDTLELKYRAGHSGTAMLLPLNGSNSLQVDILDDVLNESFYYPSGIATGNNQYDHFESNPMTNRILFSN